MRAQLSRSKVSDSGVVPISFSVHLTSDYLEGAMWDQSGGWTFVEWWHQSSLLGRWFFLILLTMFFETIFIALERTWKLRRLLKRGAQIPKLLDRVKGAKSISEAISGAS